jgi:hypothetical protein
MARSKNLPDHALVVTAYEELRRYAGAFGRGHLNLLILCGAPGLGKSQCVRDAVGPRACWVDGNATPFGIYLKAFEHRHQPLVLDDVDGLYADRNGTRLLKGICQTAPVKTVSWLTDARTLERRGVPRQFTTTSRVAILANQWDRLNADVAALEDRGHFLHFTPPAVEVHREAARWFWDQQVYDFLAAHLHLVAQPSLRTYVLAWEQKKAGLDWRAFVLSRCLKGPALEVAQLKADPSFGTEEDRAQAFVLAGFGCRATYFNHARRLVPCGPVPQLTVAGSEPAASSPDAEAYLTSLRRGFGRSRRG